MEKTEQNAIRKLEIKNLKKATSSALVMDDINLTVHEGEIFALVGSPESCKTLISKIVVNLVKKSGGEILVDGTTHSKHNRNARKIGASIQQQNFYPSQTAYKTLVQHAQLNKYPVNHAKVTNTLNLVDLKKTMHNTLNRLNLSSLSRLKIAVALYEQPEILVLDEPFKNLTPDEAHKIRTIIKTIADTKKSAVFITAANITDVEQICDTVGIIDDGLMVTVKSYNQFIRDDAPYETVRVMTQVPNYTAKVIEEDMNCATHLCGEWVVIDTKPMNAQAVADTLARHDIKLLSIQRVNRSLQEMYYEIMSARRKRVTGAP